MGVISARYKFRATWAIWLLLVGSLGASVASAEEYFDRYGLLPASPVIDLGVQPLGYPSGLISAVMRRDRVMRAELLAVGTSIKSHPFRRGADMLGLLADHRLEAGLLGDMPTILSASSGKVWIVGLVKQTATAIVAKDSTQVRGLAGKKIGYVPVSSAHHTLLQGLASAGLSEADVKLVTIGVDEMPAALARGDIDAFAAWEPAPTVALDNSSANHIVFRGHTADYFVIERHFEDRTPGAARVLVAGFVRAIEWMRRSQKNAERAARWVLEDSAAFTGKAAALTPGQIVAITRREILHVPSAPVILAAANGELPLKGEYAFLRQLGKLPPSASWENLAVAFSYDGLARVMAEPKRYQLHVFDYEE